MPSNPRTVSELYATMESLESQRAEISKEIDRLRQLINAAELLRAGGIMLDDKENAAAKRYSQSPPPPPPDRRKVPVQHSDAEQKKVAQRDAEVLDVIHTLFRDQIFTVPDLDEHALVSKRSIKRALDDMIERGQVEIVEEGYKRRATKYQLTEQKGDG